MIMKRAQREVLHSQENVIIVFKPSKEVDKYLTLGELDQWLAVSRLVNRFQKGKRKYKPTLIHRTLELTRRYSYLLPGELCQSNQFLSEIDLQTVQMHLLQLLHRSVFRLFG
jgi:hypothetical protein